MGRQIGVVQKFTGIQRLGQNWRRANGIRVAYFPRIQHCTDWEKHQKFTQEELYLCRCSTTSHVDQETKNASQMLDSFLYMQRDLDIGQWSFLGPGSEKKWYSISEDSPQREWDTTGEKMMLEFAESGHPIFRAASPLFRGQLKSKGPGKLSIHCAADLETIETIFRTIVSVNQLSLYGAIAEICEEYESLHERMGQPVVGGQSSSSFVPSVIKTEVPLDCDDPVNQDLLLQQYGERIEKLSQQDNLSKFCMDAGFLNVVEIGQYFMTQDTVEFSQFRAAACREYTLPRDEKSSQPKGWIQGNTKIGPVLEIATCCLHGKYGVEIRIMSMNKDNSHSWVRISHGSNRFVVNLNNNEQEIPEVQLEEYALKLDAKDFACRSKAKAKPQRRDPAGPSPRTIHIGKRTWTDVEPGEYSLSDYEVSKTVMYLLRHRLENWRKIFRKNYPYCPHWSDAKWKKSMAGGGNKKIFQYCADPSGQEILYLRALQGHSGRSFIDPTLQDNVVIQSNFFQYICHVGCAIKLHSIMNSGLIPWGQKLNNRQTVFFLPVDPMDKNHEDPDTIDLNAPRHTQYMHKAWKEH